MVEYVGGAGSDIFTGGVDPDLIYGEGGNDTLSGAGGDDRIYGGIGDDTPNGGDGNDLLDGGDGNDTLNGDAGADEIVTGSGNDTVNGGTGSDLIVVGANLTAADTINGGFGAGELEVLSFSGNYATSIILGATTVTNIEFFNIGAGQVRLTLNAATLNGLNARASFNGGTQLQTDLFWLDGSAATIGFNATSGAGADRLTGGSGDDDLRGAAGQDLLVGGAGNDRLEGGLDADTITGGAGNDIFVFGINTPRSNSSPSTIDVITDFAGAGVPGGDRIDLPSYAFGRGIAFNATAINFNFLGVGVESGVQLATPSALSYSSTNSCKILAILSFIRSHSTGVMSKPPEISRATAIPIIKPAAMRTRMAASSPPIHSVNGR